MLQRAFGAALLVLLALTGALAQEQEPREDGEISAVDIATPEFGLEESGATVHWQHVFDDWPGSHFLRLRFSDITVPEGSDARLVIQNISGRVIESLEADALAGMRGQWSLVVPGDYARVSLLAAAPPVGLALSIDAVAHSSWPGVAAGHIGPSDLQSIRDYASDPLIWTLSRSVAKLSFVRSGIHRVCTGFLIGPDLLLTNAHCVNTREICASTVARFGHELRPDNFLDDGRQVRCREVVRTSRGLDFAVLRLAQPVGVDFGTLTLSGQPMAPQQPAFVVQHPDGRPKEIAFRNCRLGAVGVAGVVAGVDVTHSCDTEGGSSGAPVLSMQGQVVALHHWSNGGAFPGANRAVMMARILPELRAAGVLD